MLSFDKEEDVNQIYSIKSILGCKVDIQQLKVSKLIPQCKRCQAYGHTQKYCSKEPRCVKCTGKHLKKDCQKPAEMKPKCIHCGEAHPASYRGCAVAKELQSLKNKTLKQKGASAINTERSNVKIVNKTNFTNRVEKHRTFAQTTKGINKSAQGEPPKQESLTTDDKFSKILNLLTLFDDRLKKLENSAKIAVHKQQ